MKTLLKLFFQMDSFTKHYDIKVYNLLDLTGQIGGILGIIKLIFDTIFWLFLPKLYSYSIIKSLNENDEKKLSLNQIENEGHIENEVNKIEDIMPKVPKKTSKIQNQNKNMENEIQLHKLNRK